MIEDDLNITIVVNPFIRKSGLKWNIEQLSDQMMADGHNVKILTFDGDTRQEFVDEGRSIIRCKSAQFFPPFASHLNVKVCKEMRRYEGETDVFHVFNTNCTPGGGLYKLLGGKTPVVSTLNNWGLVCPSYKLEIGDPFSNHNLFERSYCTLKAARSPLEQVASIPYAFYFSLEKKWLGKHVDRHAAISKYVKRVYEANGYAENIKVTSNHLDDEFLDSIDAGHETPNIDNEFTLLYVGRLTKSKGIDVLLDAVENADVGIKLLTAGWGPFEEKVKNSPSTDHLGFVGRRELPKYYHRSDVFVHPAPRPEPFGKTILEALHCDLPIICSNVGAPPELAGDACKLFESESGEDLKEKIEFLAAHPEELADMARSCKRERQEYSFERVYSKTMEVYDEVLKKRKQV